MIVQEILEDDPTLVRTYSDQGHVIMSMESWQMYEEAIDPVSENRQYMEVPLNSGVETPLPEECVNCKYYKAYNET